MPMHNPAHPGKVLKELMGDAEVTAFAARLGVDRTTLSRLLNARAGIFAPMALKLETALDTSAEMWMTMQARYDLFQARQLTLAIEPATPARRTQRSRASIPQTPAFPPLNR